MVELLLIAAATGSTPTRADLFSNLWILIIIVYVVISVISGLFRTARRASGGDANARGSPAQRFPTAQQPVAAAQRQAVPSVATLARRPLPAPAPAATVSQMPATVTAPAQPLRQNLVDVLTQMLRSGAQIDASTVSAAPAGPAPTLPPAPPPALDFSATTQISPTLGAAQPPSGLSPDLAELLGRLATPSGLAFAVVAAAIVGTPQGLRTEPQHPGGW